MRRGQVFLRLGAGAFVCLTMLFLYVWQPTLLRQTDLRIYDIFLRENAGGEPSPTPAIIDLDEASLEALGQWPWPRHLVARLVKELTESGVAAIGFDILLSEPDRTSPVQLQKSLRQGFGVNIDFKGLPDYLEDNDALLAGILQQSPSVLGMYTQFSKQGARAVPSELPVWEGIMERAPLDAPSLQNALLQGEGATLPLPGLRDVVPLGTINVAPDSDGIVRSVPLLTKVGDRIFPSLALRSLMRGLGVSNITLEGGPDGLMAVRIGKYSIPVTPSGHFQLPFRGPRGVYPYFRAMDVLQGKVAKEDLQGRVVFIGTSAPGLLDIRVTPFDAVYPGVETHAAVVDAILSKRSLQTPAWIPGAQVIAICVLGALGALAFSLAPAAVYMPLLLLLGGGSIWGSWRTFQEGIFISPLYVLLTIVALAVSLLAVRFWQESKQRRVLRQAFSRYVAPDMVDRIAERGEAVLAGEQREVTLMFTDIRGFTSLSEKLDPSQVVSVLNRYFTPMTAIIRNSGGTVDKFIGDAIMAFWNAPLDVPEHELCAVKSALNMQEALAELNNELESEFGVALRMGIGVHTGKVYVGNMGSAELLDYTCIGDNVNLTSRLEGLCPVYGVGVVVSAASAQQIVSKATEGEQGNIDEKVLPETAIAAETEEMASREPILRAPGKNGQPGLVFVVLDAIRVKGKTLPVEICTPLNAAEAEERADELTSFAAARASYLAGDFKAAGQAFGKLRQQFSERLLYGLYEERSLMLGEDPPADWDGVWTFTKK